MSSKNKKPATKKTASNKRKPAKAGAPSAKLKAAERQVFSVDKYLNNLVAPAFDARDHVRELAADLRGQIADAPQRLKTALTQRIEGQQELLSDEFTTLLAKLEKSAPVRFLDETAQESQRRAVEQMDAALARVGLIRASAHDAILEKEHKKAERSRKSALTRQKKRLEKARKSSADA